MSFVVIDMPERGTNNANSSHNEITLSPAPSLRSIKSNKWYNLEHILPPPYIVEKKLLPKSPNNSNNDSSIHTENLENLHDVNLNTTNWEIVNPGNYNNAKEPLPKELINVKPRQFVGGKRVLTRKISRRNRRLNKQTRRR
jgi:hypothetical protein